MEDRIGPYRIGAPLGSGGMGTVFRGEHEETGAAVAIKVLHFGDESMVHGFRREVHALMRLRHPGIVRILDVGTEAERPFYAMELLEGRPLSLLLERGAVDRSQTLTLGARLARVLAYLHGEGLVHRDLKPQNIVLEADDRPVLVDFGLSLRAAGPVSREPLEVVETSAGTLPYMAPEQIRGELLDARADLYSLGCILYEMLTGQRPFPERSMAELAAAHLDRAPTPPSMKVGDVPPELDDLVLGLLAKSPQERVGHADAVAARLLELGGSVGPRARRSRAILYRPRFVGREAELRRVTTQVDEGIEQGHGALLLIAAESGAGKTRLAMEIARSLRRDFTLLSGECLPGGAPLHPLRNALAHVSDRCRNRGPEETLRLLGPRAYVLGAQFPPLLSVPGLDTVTRPPTLAPDAAQFRLLAALVGTLTALAETDPVCLILDDLQWADETTLGLLERLARDRALEACRLVVLGTYRTDEAPAALDQVAEGRFATRVPLGRLDEAAIGAIASDMLAVRHAPDGLVRFLVGRSEGNPFFVAEYLRAAVAEGCFRRDDRGRWHLLDEGDDDSASYARLPLPGTLRELVSRRLDALGATARRVVRLAAVLGRRSDVEVLEQCLSGQEADLLAALEELVGRQVLEEEQGGGLRFVHDRIHEVAYERLEREERVRLHERVARALETRQVPDPPTLAHHWKAAGQPVAALAYSLASAHAQRRAFDNERAIESYGQVLDVLDRPELAVALRTELDSRRELWIDDAERAFVPSGAKTTVVTDARRQAAEGLGDVLRIVGRYDAALGAFRTAAAGDASPEAKALLLGKIGRTHFGKGELGVGASCLTEALSAVGVQLEQTSMSFDDLEASVVPEPTRSVARGEAHRREVVRIQLLNQLTYIQYSFDLTRALQTHVLALASAERVPRTAEAAETFCHHGPVVAGAWPDRALRFGRRAIEICEREGHLRTLMVAHVMAGTTALFLGRWDEGRDHFRRVYDLYPEVGDVHSLQVAREVDSHRAIYAGELDAAFGHAEAARELARRHRDTRGLVNASHHLALAHHHADEPSAARKVLDEALESLPDLEDDAVHVMVHTLDGIVARRENRLDAAESAFRRATDIATSGEMSQWETAPCWYERAAFLIDHDPVDLTEVERLLDRAHEAASRFPAHRAYVLEVEATLATAVGDIVRATRLEQEAAQAYESIGVTRRPSIRGASEPR